MANCEREEAIIISEREVDSHSIGIATTTFYKNWYPGELQEYNTVDKIRGDLAILMLKEAAGKGFQVVAIDGGSSDMFKQELARIGINVSPEQERGMSGSRRQALREAGELEGIKVLIWTEPEKVSFAKDCLPLAALPILKGKADIVVPKRDEKAFGSYPDYQTIYERKSNHLWNDILRKHNLLAQDVEDLDVWFGPKLIKNDSSLIDLFYRKYEYLRTPPITVRDENHRKDLRKIYNPELWPDATFLPVVNALQRGYRVVSVNVPYLHPAEQTEIEKDDADFRRKRDIQYKNIIISTIHLVKAIENNPRSRLRPVS